MTEAKAPKAPKAAKPKKAVAKTAPIVQAAKDMADMKKARSSRQAADENTAKVIQVSVPAGAAKTTTKAQRTTIRSAPANADPVGTLQVEIAAPKSKAPKKKALPPAEQALSNEDGTKDDGLVLSDLERQHLAEANIDPAELADELKGLDPEAVADMVNRRLAERDPTRPYKIKPQRDGSQVEFYKVEKGVDYGRWSIVEVGKDGSVRAYHPTKGWMKKMRLTEEQMIQRTGHGRKIG